MLTSGKLASVRNYLRPSLSAFYTLWRPGKFRDLVGQCEMVVLRVVVLRIMSEGAGAARLLAIGSVTPVASELIRVQLH